MGLAFLDRLYRNRHLYNRLSMSLGMTIISAQISARRIMSFALLPMTAISSSMTTFTSQNFGAKQFRRIQQGVKQACLLSLLWSVFVAILLFFTSPFLTSLISGSTNPNLIANASLYLQISSCFYPVLGCLLILGNSLQGIGRKLTPLISSFIELTGKILFVLLIIPHTGYIGVILCEPSDLGPYDSPTLVYLPQSQSSASCTISTRRVHNKTTSAHLHRSCFCIIRRLLEQS
ncbi:MAG: MATE family efflux transporter [Streptococcus parasanguinis]